MTWQIVIISVILVIVVAVIGFSIYDSWKLRRKVRNNWQKLPYEPRFDKEESLQQAYQNAAAFTTKDSYVDDITWYDLDLFEVFQQINHTYSSIGSEQLYQRIRGFDFTSQEEGELEALIQYFDENPQMREDTEFIFASLGKKDKNFVASYLADGKKQQLANIKFHVLLGLLPISCVITGLFIPQFMLVALAALCFNLFYYMGKKQTVERELNSMAYLVQMISAAKKIRKLPLPNQAALTKAVKPLESILKFSFSFRVKTNTEMDMFFDYINMMFMLPLITYHFILARLEKENAAAIQVWQLLGKLEVAYAILNYRKIVPLNCRPTFTETGGIIGEAVYHPLVDNAVANPVAWQKNTLVTGSNASGKSTYVKAIAINAILSQTIYTTLAESFTMPAGHVLTSMAVEDNIFAGDSYFVAEIKSVKRVLQQVASGECCYCFIDEILKGTNTIERISASASIVNWLKDKNVLAFVATHDIELTEILKDSCDNLHFEEQVTEEEGIAFDYRLRKGPAVSRNAIQLLKILDYPQAIVDEAFAEAESFDAQRQWRQL
ncbi:hypothetical protein M2139_000412 [Enterococcus sp. PF1-24]|uniref:MutS-related protein n=1 Tax=unclassified Enterococcus TaxID=2608891 RepID=UPI002475B107|nr:MULTISPECIES: DNA mismatch repair protein MutS [unclassified Enterococcus]MDH6363437.1 hypothetical protein [Enterococcus sp. PFB1-1]MDH6400531.1 hypothetical protein [Enterococcus sp. PF1-24]